MARKRQLKRAHSSAKHGWACHLFSLGCLAHRPEAVVKACLCTLHAATSNKDLRCPGVSIYAAYLAPGPNAKLAHEVALCLP